MTSVKNNSRVLSLVTILWVLAAGLVTVVGNVGCDATQLSSLMNSFGITEETIQSFVDSVAQTYSDEADSYGGCDQGWGY